MKTSEILMLDCLLLLLEVGEDGSTEDCVE